MLLQLRWKAATITLRTMTDGSPHPRAKQQVIPLDLPSASPEWGGELYINHSRLGFVHRPADTDDHRVSVVVWDWTTGEMLLVCGSRSALLLGLTPITLMI